MDTFIERNGFGLLGRILTHNNRFVNLQIIQTVSIMLQNIKSIERRCKPIQILTFSLDYMLSHPFLQILISHKYNFYDEEIVDTLVNFLRSLALKIDAGTIQFFANERTKNFPLLAVT